MLKNRDLLVVTINYSSFVKNPIDIISKNFNHINVLARYNPIAGISNYLPINYLKPHRKEYLIDYTDKPSNVTIFPTPISYIPSNIWYKQLGGQHFRVVDRIINKNKVRFDMIHSHFTWTPGYVGVKLKEKYEVPLIITAHGFDVYDLPFVDETWKEKIGNVLNQADAVITVSRRNVQYLRELKVQIPIQVIPNGFKPDIFYPIKKENVRENLHLPRNKKIIFTAGRLIPIKGYRILIDAISEIKKHRQDILCLIAGSGSQKNHLQRQVKKLNLNEYVKLIGEKPQNEIPLWINACDIFVLPSLNEGNPTVMFESLGCGKPFIGTNVGGIPEIINSNDYGFICKPGDAKDLAEKILIALNTNWDNKTIVEYSDRFTWINIVKKLLEVYISVLEK